MTRNTKQTGSVLGLSTPAPALQHGNGNSTALGDGKGLSKRQHKVVEEANTQVLVMRIHAGKTALGLPMADELNRTAHSLFVDTAEYICATTEEAQGKPHEQYVAEFGHHLIQRDASTKLSLLDSGIYRIGLEVERPVYMEPEPQVSLLQRLFGK